MMDKKLIPSNWLKKPLKKGVGMRYLDPLNKGDAIFIVEKGYKKASDLLHSGSYLKICKNGKKIRIPLKGNPAL